MAPNYFERERPARKQIDDIEDVPVFLRGYVVTIAVITSIVYATGMICTTALMILGTVKLFRIYG